MGFLSDLKNKVTGGAALVQVRVGTVRRGEPVTVQVHATMKASTRVNAVYVVVRAVERCQVRDADYDDGHRRTELVRGRRISFEHRVALAGAQDLQDGQSYAWSGQLEIPISANPSFNGRIIDHEWELAAGLDMAGNDPDSGWQRFTVL
jgi:hypothetical protein